jgi:hypothetical protein
LAAFGSATVEGAVLSSIIPFITCSLLSLVATSKSCGSTISHPDFLDFSINVLKNPLNSVYLIVLCSTLAIYSPMSAQTAASPTSPAKYIFEAWVNS